MSHLRCRAAAAVLLLGGATLLAPGEAEGQWIVAGGAGVEIPIGSFHDTQNPGPFVGIRLGHQFRNRLLLGLTGGVGFLNGRSPDGLGIERFGDATTWRFGGNVGYLFSDLRQGAWVVALGAGLGTTLLTVDPSIGLDGLPITGTGTDGTERDFTLNFAFNVLRQLSSAFVAGFIGRSYVAFADPDTLTSFTFELAGGWTP